jgi:hypothetical protein
MNCLIGGMMLVAAIAFVGNAAAHDPAEPLFLFRMSLGAAFALPMNWWLASPQARHVGRAAER